MAEQGAGEPGSGPEPTSPRHKGSSAHHKSRKHKHRSLRPHDASVSISTTVVRSHPPTHPSLPSLVSVRAEEEWTPGPSRPHRASSRLVFVPPPVSVQELPSLPPVAPTPPPSQPQPPRPTRHSVEREGPEFDERCTACDAVLPVWDAVCDVVGARAGREFFHILKFKRPLSRTEIPSRVRINLFLFHGNYLFGFLLAFVFAVLLSMPLALAFVLATLCVWFAVTWFPLHKRMHAKLYIVVVLLLFVGSVLHHLLLGSLLPLLPVVTAALFNGLHLLCHRPDNFDTLCEENDTVPHNLPKRARNGEEEQYDNDHRDHDDDDEDVEEGRADEERAQRWRPAREASVPAPASATNPRARAFLQSGRRSQSERSLGDKRRDHAAPTSPRSSVSLMSSASEQWRAQENARAQAAGNGPQPEAHPLVCSRCGEGVKAVLLVPCAHALCTRCARPPAHGHHRCPLCAKRVLSVHSLQLD